MRTPTLTESALAPDGREMETCGSAMQRNAHSVRPHVSEARNQQVLVVDDDHLVLAAYVRALTRNRTVIVRAAADLATARRLAVQHRPNLAIIDMHLPDGCGIALVSEMRAVDPSATLVLVTAYGSIESAVRGMRVGASDVLPKPITIGEIMRRINYEACDETLEIPSLDAAMWDHIQRVLAHCDGNVSLAARLLKIHRSRLRRWLAQRAPR